VPAACSATAHTVALGVSLGFRVVLQQSSPYRPPFSLFLLSMARDHARRSPRPQTPQIQQPRCPSCGKRFSDVLRHLNHRESKCADWLNTTAPHHGLSSHRYEHPTGDTIDSLTPDDFPDTQQPPSPPPSQPYTHAQHVGFPGAAKTFGRAKTFMERFDDDKYSGFRTTNIYYPFAGKDEWELGSFLLSSGLSMKKIDDFLRLKMVILSALFLITVR